MDTSLEFSPSDSRGKPLGACPQCGRKLEQGRVAIQGTFWGWLFFGASYQHLWFRPDRGDERKVLHSGDSCVGWRCGVCGFVGVRGSGKDEGA